MIHEEFYPDWLLCKDVRLLLSCLQSASLQAKFVGGSVRDSLLGLKISDLDMAIHSDPETVRRVLTESRIKTTDYGMDHGTVTAVFRHRQIEITSLRTDVQTYGRRAKVAFGSSWQEDSERRDFTINAIYLSPQGELWDPQGGIEDLHNRVVRFIGDPQKRVREDFLRILRFFRFSAFYGREELHAASLKACIDNCHNLNKISVERIRSEMLRLLTAPCASRLIKIMHDSKILAQILPTVDQTFAGLLHLEDQAKNHNCHAAAEGWLRLISLCPTDQWQNLSKAWKFSRQETRRLKNILAVKNDLPNNELKQKLLVYEYNKQCLSDLILLSGLSYDIIRNTMENWNPATFPLNGDDLLSDVPKKRIGEVLQITRRWWVMSQKMRADRQECLKYALQVAHD